MDFIEQIQSDELISGQFYNGEYMPTDQDLEDMNEAWDLDNRQFDYDESQDSFDLSNDGDALASAGHGMDEDYCDGDQYGYDTFEW